jgi:hypothetical protein
MWFIGALLLISLAYAETFCIEVENETNEPYLSYAVMKFVEKAVLESGATLSCKEDHKNLRVRIVRFKETPIAYTPEQRVSSYNLSLSLKLELEGREFTLSGSVPYTLPTGGLGDIPRRKAIDDLLDKIYWNLLQNLRR